MFFSPRKSRKRKKEKNRKTVSIRRNLECLVLVVKTRGGTAGSEEHNSDGVGSRLEGAGVSKYTNINKDNLSINN